MLLPTKCYQIMRMIEYFLPHIRPSQLRRLLHNGRMRKRTWLFPEYCPQPAPCLKIICHPDPWDTRIHTSVSPLIGEGALGFASDAASQRATAWTHHTYKVRLHYLACCKLGNLRHANLGLSWHKSGMITLAAWIHSLI